MAWLRAIPETPALKKAQRGAVIQPQSRLEAMGDRAQDIEYPPCEAAHIAQWFFDVGPVLYGGMGPTPLTHAEIDAWQRNTGITLTSWESGMLRDLSIVYINMMEQAKHPSCPAPWRAEPVEEPDRRELVAKKVREMLRG